MLTILTDFCGVCLSVCLSRGRSVQPLSNYFDHLLFHITAGDIELKLRCRLYRMHELETMATDVSVLSVCHAVSLGFDVQSS